MININKSSKLIENEFKSCKDYLKNYQKNEINHILDTKNISIINNIENG